MHFFQANAMFFGWFSHFFEFRLHEYWVVTPPGEVALYRTLVQTHSWSQPTWLHCNCYSSSSSPPSPVTFAWVSTSYVFKDYSTSSKVFSLSCQLPADFQLPASSAAPLSTPPSSHPPPVTLRWKWTTFKGAEPHHTQLQWHPDFQIRNDFLIFRKHEFPEEHCGQGKVSDGLTDPHNSERSERGLSSRGVHLPPLPRELWLAGGSSEPFWREAQWGWWHKWTPKPKVHHFGTIPWLETPKRLSDKKREWER